MGIYNSSHTRVRPFFNTLLDRDRGGASWLTKLLALGHNEQALSSALLADPGLLHPTHIDKERRLSPPKEFLKWLILNPEKMTWPGNGTARFGTETQQWREKLMGRQDLSREPFDRRDEIRDADRKTAIAEGLRGLDQFGPAGSRMKWWAFEGFTAVDCYLATDKLKIYVEGKFTDVLSPSTNWYRNRNQLMRNLESAQADAKGDPFVCLLITEDEPLGILDAKKIQSSLPHLAHAQQQDLMLHFLGATTWRQACLATGVNYGSLASTV